METWQDQARAIALSIGIHLICFGLIYWGMMLQKSSRPLSVAGAPIEAVLWTGPLPTAAPLASAPPPSRAQPSPPPAKAEPTQPIQRPDSVDRERAAALTQQQSRERAQREEQERQRQRQIELSEQERQRQARAEAARRALEEDRRRQDELAQARTEREQAERQARLQQERLAQLSDLERQPVERAAPVEGPRTEPRDDQPVGNFGTDTGLAAQYMLAIQQTVTQNWLRPDTTRPGLQCRLRIIQIPGGEVISAQVIAPCNGDDLARRSIEAAVLRAQPLPYSGYESVFQRDITFNFRYDG